MSDLVHQSQVPAEDHRWEVVDPFSGTLLSLEDPALAADFLNRLRQSDLYVQKAKQACEERILAEMDAQAKWTIRWGNIQVEAPSPAAAATPGWEDVPGLMAQLEAEGLAKERIIGAPDSLVTVTLSHKVSKREADRIAKISLQHKAIIESHWAPRPKRRSVQVKVGGAAE